MAHRLSTCLGLLLATVVAGCGDDGPASFGDDLADVQVPPRGSEDLLAWIDAGHYQSWSCEPEAHAQRSPSPHGRNRICSNDALGTATGDGPFPAGAAGVKEIFDGAGNITLYAVYRKVEDGTSGDSWYWYEGNRGDVIANGEGEDKCTGCHARAPRDFVFTVVR